MTNLSFETAVDIQAPKDQVFSYVADFPRHTEWNHQPQEMTALTDGPVQVGSQYKTMEAPPSNMSPEEMKMFSEMWPKMMEAHDFEGHTVAEVTALEPNERIAWTARGSVGLFVFITVGVNAQHRRW